MAASKPYFQAKRVLRPSAGILFGLLIVVVVFGSGAYVLGFYLR